MMVWTSNAWILEMYKKVNYIQVLLNEFNLCLTAIGNIYKSILDMHLHSKNSKWFKSWSGNLAFYILYALKLFNVFFLSWQNVKLQFVETFLLLP